MRVTVVCSNLRHDTIRLQPGRYITEIVKYLQASDHSTTVITDTGRNAPKSSAVNEANVQVVKTVRILTRWNNAELETKICTSRADVLLWVIGQSSFWHLTWPEWIESPVVGLFTSPIYTPREILRLGVKELYHNPQFYSFYLFSALAPDWMARRVLKQATVSLVVILSQAVRRRLQATGISDQRLKIILPGLDHKVPADQLTNISSAANDGKTLTALYLGSPQLYRGPDVALRAVARLRDVGVSIKLTILSRRSKGQFEHDEQKLHCLIEGLRLQNQVNIVSGFLPPIEVQRHLYQADMVLLPFKLIPSEMPLTVIEGMRQGKPVITSSLASMIDLLGEGRGLTVPPNRPDDLAEAMMSLIDSPAKRQAIGQLAQNYIESWPTWEDTGRNVEAILQQVKHNGYTHA